MPRPSVPPPAAPTTEHMRARRRGLLLILGWLFVLGVVVFLVASAMTTPDIPLDRLHFVEPTTYGPPAALGALAWPRWRRVPPVCDYCSRDSHFTLTRQVKTWRGTRLVHYRACDWPQHIAWSTLAAAGGPRR